MIRQQGGEIYSGLRVRAPFFIRADGRGFRKLLKDADKPYDLDFARTMVKAARYLMEEVGPSPRLAYLFSDEASLLYLDEPFGGRLEKLISVIPSVLSGRISLSLGRAVGLDGRAILVCPDQVAAYLKEAQDEAWRNHIFSYGFYSRIKEGMDRRSAMESLRGKSEGQIHEMLFCQGINLAHCPAWQRRGVMVYRSSGDVFEEWELPLFGTAEGQGLVKSIIEDFPR